MDQRVAGDQQKQRQSDADQSGAQSDYESLGVEDLGDIPFGSADGPEDPDLLFPFQVR